jgi:ApaG protein
MERTPLFQRETHGIRVSVQPVYLPADSRPEQAHFVYAYFVKIENRGDEPAQLVRRFWHIHDPEGGDTEIEGEGVVGEQPLLAPGTVHEYNSYCVLNGPLGHMEGRYHFSRPDGSTFAADIPRFPLAAITPPGQTH